MTDKELLEYAAKAAGVEGKYQSNGLEGWSGICLMDYTGNFPTQEWNPLTDDGDALRLAVKLNFDVSAYVADEHGPACTIAAGYESAAYHKEIHCDDPYAATRRAIVRAAAEIGKGMTSCVGRSRR